MKKRTKSNETLCERLDMKTQNVAQLTTGLLFFIHHQFSFRPTNKVFLLPLLHEAVLLIAEWKQAEHYRIVEFEQVQL